MLAGALVLTFGAASTLQGWATSSRANYASATTAPAIVAPLATASERASPGAQRARSHVVPHEVTNTDQVAQSKI